MFELGSEVLGGSHNGISTYEQWEAFSKAVQTSSYETDHAELTGMSALRIQSLEATLRSVVASDNDFTFFNRLKREAVVSAVHEFNVQTSRGGQVDGMNIGELGDVQFDVGDYQRVINRIKLFATGAQVGHFASSQTLTGPQLISRENTNAVVRIANAVERASWHANSAYSPNKIDGFFAQLENFQGGKYIIDLKGTSDIDVFRQALFQANADVRQPGSFGKLTDFYTDMYMQNDLDNLLFPQFRVQMDSNPNALTLGAPVSGIKTSYGVLKANTSIWMNNAANTQPQVVQLHGKVPDSVPAKPTLTLASVNTPAGGADGWTSARAGTFYGAIAYVDADGREGIPSDIVSATVAAGNGLSWSGARGTGGATPTAARLYRSMQTPGSAPTLADLRLVCEVPVALDGTFTYVDVNQNIPGSSHAAAMNFVPGSIQWLQMRPITQFPLFPTAKLVKPWAVVLYGALQLGLPQHHRGFKGYIPKDAPWRPFKN